MVLLMATETRFWRNLCQAVDRMDLFERWPGKAHADHDYGNDALREELSQLFATRSTVEWLALFVEHDVAGAPVYEAGETHRDAHFEARDLWIDSDTHLIPLLGSPVRVAGERAVAPRPAPAAGADGERILREVLGYDTARVDALRAAGALGSDA